MSGTYRSQKNLRVDIKNHINFTIIRESNTLYKSIEN